MRYVFENNVMANDMRQHCFRLFLDHYVISSSSKIFSVLENCFDIHFLLCLFMFFVLFRSFLGCCSDSDSEMEPFRNSGTILAVLLLVALFLQLLGFNVA